MKSSKKVLFVTYHFSYLKSVAAPRSISFYKYCRDFFTPVILTRDSEKESNLTNVFSAEDIHCYETELLDWIKSKDSELDLSLYQTFKSTQKEIFNDPEKVNNYFYMPKNLSKKSKILHSYLFESTVLSSDLYWIENGLKAAELIFKNHSISAIYCSFPPIASLELGYQLSKKYNVPLITEFRDGLAFEPLLPCNDAQYELFKILENKYCNQSNTIISIGNNLTKHFNSVYPDIPCQTIFNGYDPELFPNNNKKIQPTQIRFASFGSFSKSKMSVDINPMIDAIKFICQKYDRKLSFYFIGNLADHEVLLINTLKSESNATIAISPHVDKKEGLKFLANNIDYLLFLGVKNETTIISSKLFDFINLDIPIVGICKGNESETIINETQTGEVCGFNTNEIINLLEKAVKKELKFSPQKEKINFFTRENQAILLGKLMKKILN